MNADLKVEDSELIARADAAAGARRFGEALQLLSQVLDSGRASVDTLLKAASLYRANSEPRRALAVSEQALALEPLHFLALFFRAGLLEQIGDAGAARAYGEALAQRGGAKLSPTLERAVQRAERIYADFLSASGEQIRQAITAAAPDADAFELGRLRRFASNVARETFPHRTDPTHFFFPGLPEYEFHDRDFFPWLDALEAATDVIRGELLEVLNAKGAVLVPYVQYAAQVPMRQWKPLNNNFDWTAIHLIHSGQRVEENAQLCPQTMALLDALPQPKLAGSSPNAMFSLLKPHTRIPPHHGVANFRLVCHLPLIVPDQCWFRVGATRIQWKVGQAFVFDDTIEHEAANDSDDLRAVLIVDSWHPALSKMERVAIERMFAEVPSVQGLL